MRRMESARRWVAGTSRPRAGLTTHAPSRERQQRYGHLLERHWLRGGLFPAQVMHVNTCWAREDLNPQGFHGIPRAGGELDIPRSLALRDGEVCSGWEREDPRIARRSCDDRQVLEQGWTREEAVVAGVSTSSAERTRRSPGVDESAWTTGARGSRWCAGSSRTVVSRGAGGAPGSRGWRAQRRGDPRRALRWRSA